MPLDIRTIMVIFAVLSIMFSGLLALAGFHAGNVKGVRQWSAASLCLGLGLGFSYFYNSLTPGKNWAVVFSSIFIATGIALQLSGIQAFNCKRFDWRIAALIVGLVFLNGLWFSVLNPDITTRAILNSILFAIVYAASAKSLLIKIEQPLRTAYWFTGLSFLILVFVSLTRAVLIWKSVPQSYGLFENTPLNPVTFFVACMVQLCVTFGFILMLDYRLVSDLQKIASRDTLTGAFNRRRLEEEAIRLCARSKRTRDTLSIMMIDVDHFKSVNDRFGHQAGDEVLRRLAVIAQSTIRVDDYFARYGGEEFCILLPSTKENETLQLAERLRETYSSLQLEYNGIPISSTISIGVADSDRAGLEFSSLVAAADKALYLAKQEGRNRVVLLASV